MPQPLDQVCINTLRFLSVDMIEKASSGHPGLPLDAAPMAYVLWTRYLKHNPRNPEWFDRDRFVLSAGHGSALLYSLLHLTGYGVSLDDLQQFRQLGSITPGHPEYRMTPGVEVSTGPLGQGFASAVGMAIAEASLGARYNRPGAPVIDHYTYVLSSDGDMMEGVVAEAASLAGHLKLGKLICLYDSNRTTLAASTDITFSDDTAARFRAYGWHVQEVMDGNDVDAIDEALQKARAETEFPSLIIVHTTLAYGSPNKQGSYLAHGAALGADEVQLTKQNLGWPVEPLFHVPEEARQCFGRAVVEGAQAEQVWQQQFQEYQRQYPDVAQELVRMIRGELPANWDADLPTFPASEKGERTRQASGQVMNAIAPHLPELIGGSADLNPSTYTVLQGMGDFQHPDHAGAKTDRQGESGGGWTYTGRNIHFGVREHAMGSILNGLAVHGAVLPFGSTFFVFSDYMKPAIRLAALMRLRVIYVFTHDSLALGEDGPTHQPVEQLASLRAIPDLYVIRPCDANETVEAWRVAVQTACCPVALVLTRQNVPTLDRSHLAPAAGLHRGAYVLSDSDGDPDIILIASGAEVHLILGAQKRLQEQGIHARVVSMPCWELFREQPEEYRDSVLPPHITARLAVEMGVAQGWCRYVGLLGEVVGLNDFGASGPADAVMAKYGFSVDNVVERALAVLARPGLHPPTIPG